MSSRVPEVARAFVAALVFGFGLPGCQERVDAQAERPAPSSAGTSSPGTSGLSASSSLDKAPHGNAHRGRELAAAFECNRCHDGTDLDTVPREKHCVHCHQDILAGRFEPAHHAEPQHAPRKPRGRSRPSAASHAAIEAALATWQKDIVHLREVPSLASAPARLRRSWVESFLRAPYVVRPRLGASMPRLAISEDQARDLAAYLAPDDDSPPQVDPPGNAAHGRALLDSEGCGTCHTFSGAPPLVASPLPVAIDAAAMERALLLAPDLATVRERMRPDALVATLRDPRAVKPDSAMPRIPLSAEDARDIAAYLTGVPLAAPELRPVPARLPPLTRRVSFEEVTRRVFRKTCWHCHSEPDYALGDGGPGNTGGFGFPPRGINLAAYAGIASGMIDEGSTRRSLFSPTSDRTPLLLRALRARQEEEAGRVVDGVRGMPLGLPSLDPEDIQLVETWVTEGRPL